MTPWSLPLPCEDTARGSNMQPRHGPHRTLNLLAPRGGASRTPDSEIWEIFVCEPPVQRIPSWLDIDVLFEKCVLTSWKSEQHWDKQSLTRLEQNSASFNTQRTLGPQGLPSTFPKHFPWVPTHGRVTQRNTFGNAITVSASNYLVTSLPMCSFAKWCEIHGQISTCTKQGSQLRCFTFLYFIQLEKNESIERRH